jgi:type I restriction enzyme S subunit
VFLFYSLFNGFKITSKATIAHLTGEKLKATLIPLPPIGLQNQFAAIIKKVDALKSRYQQSLTDLESLYGALSQKAFKGELDLSKVALPVDTLERGVRD